VNVYNLYHGLCEFFTRLDLNFTLSIRVDVKRRLNAPYQREQSQLEKLRRALKPEEFAAAMVNITDR